MFQYTHVVKLAFASLVALGLSLATEEAKAGTIGYSGSNCSPTANSVQFVDYNPYSIFSTGNPAAGLRAKVSCPLPVPFNAATTGSLQTVTVLTYDRDPGAFSDNNISCSIFYQNSAGATITGPAKTEVFFSVAVAHPFTLTVAKVVTGATMICDLPAPTASGFSHILNYSVTTL